MCDHLRSHVSLSHFQEHGTPNKAYMGETTDLITEEQSSEALACTFCQGENHSVQRCNKRRTAERRKRFVCKTCKKKGHFTSECAESVKEAPETEKQGTEDISLMATTYHALVTVDHRRDQWVVDSGATRHMCINPSAFQPERIPSSGEVLLGDASAVPVSFTGDVKLNLVRSPSNSCPVTLKDVLAVEKLSRNLLSVSSCLKNGVDVNFSAATLECHLLTNGKLIGRAVEENGLWILQEEPKSVRSASSANVGSPSPVRVFSVEERKSLKLWHLRYGHLNADGLKQLLKKNMVTGLGWEKVSNDDLAKGCEVCNLGKQHKHAFPPREYPISSEPLELVHSDLIGPITPGTVQNAKYVCLPSSTITAGWHGLICFNIRGTLSLFSWNGKPESSAKVENDSRNSAQTTEENILATTSNLTAWRKGFNINSLCLTILSKMALQKGITELSSRWPEA